MSTQSLDVIQSLLGCSTSNREVQILLLADRIIKVRVKTEVRQIWERGTGRHRNVWSTCRAAEWKGGSKTYTCWRQKQTGSLSITSK